MSIKNSWIDETPKWVWWSFLPVVGGLAITYAGNKSKISSWKYYGLTLFGLGLILSYSELAIIIWLAQIVTSFTIRKKYLVKVASRTASIDNYEIAKLLAQERGQIDINDCSKDELVYDLNLPIVYANDIEDLRDEGYIFTSIEELADLSGIPERVFRKIEPLITFGYDIKKESDISWRRVNSFSVQELIACNLDSATAKKIVEEREKAGAFKSLVDIKKRTALPLSCYKNLV
ncbi:MAG: helix-hairpin-helix domain-containing protein [Xenococcaceae cyanobacterium MO_188.B19]|nr:helix-hairpin-helix domain-containing protein [Xenococcaceae cyanobacterium MO_188.B19]